MPIFKRKSDPISARAKELSAQITRLETEIRQLSSRIDGKPNQPRVRSTTLPHGPTVRVQNPGPVSEHIFEQLETASASPEVESTPSHYNELGVRKFDLLGALKRLLKHFRGPPAANPKLVSYLAAGSIKGLRPLRYEKRIARNRFLALSVFFVLVLWGILAVIFSHR